QLQRTRNRQRSRIKWEFIKGADLQAVDAIKGKTAKEWATFTGRFETTARIRSLLRRPRAEQFTARYRPEWPALAQLVAKALSPKSRSKRLLEKIRSFFTFSIPRDPEEDGVLDHMVRMTTALASPFVATACQTVCPDSPPEVGKRRLSVPEILRQRVSEPEEEPESSSRPGSGGSSYSGGSSSLGGSSRAAASPSVPLHPWLAWAPTWLPCFASSLRLCSQLSRGRAAHGAAVASAVPAWLLPRRGKGGMGPHRPLSPLPS
uniref:Uncharacterized protein n=1 Tax=Taeniopygia guttata TaxID=59729 RepID=A0A674GG11_TAEGU